MYLPDQVAEILFSLEGERKGEIERERDRNAKKSLHASLPLKRVSSGNFKSSRQD